MEKDTLSTLLFSEAACRAHMVRLEQTWQKITTHNKNLPSSVQQLLGQLVAASSMLAATLKFDGSLVIQLQGDGPVQLMMAECNNNLGIRATVKLSPSYQVSGHDTFKTLVNQNNKGLCIIILDPKNRQPGQQPYQGIVPLQGDSIAQALEAYMSESEQLNTKLLLFSSPQTVAGILIQQMPRTGGKKSSKKFDPDSWNTLVALSDTTKPEEIIKLSTSEMSHRLFHQLSPELLSTRIPKFECTCSRSKVSRMLINLGEQEIFQALSEQPHLDIDCEFCNATYHFTETQCRRLFEDHDLEGYAVEQMPDEASTQTSKATPRRTLH